MKKRLVILAVALAAVLVLSGCCLSHDWQEATCEEGKICLKCEKTDGEALGHSWQEATCAAPKTCERCGLTNGKALAHVLDDGVLRSCWKEAEDTSAPAFVRTCTVCGGEEPVFEGIDLASGQWTGVESMIGGEAGEMKDGALFMEFGEDGSVFISENGKGYFGTWKSDDFLLSENVVNTADLDDRVKTGEKIYWDQILELSVGGGSVTASISGENKDELLMDFGSTIYRFTRGRTPSEEEKKALELIPGRWVARAVTDEEGNYYSVALGGASGSLEFYADGSGIMDMASGQSVYHEEGSWRYVGYVNQNGADYYRFAADLDVVYQILVTTVETDQFGGLIPAGLCLVVDAGSSLMYFTFTG